MKIRLRYPASPENARDHAAIAVRAAREDWDSDLDYTRGSLEELDAQIDSLREEGLDGEEAAETLFVFGCYLGEVLVRQLGGAWVATARSARSTSQPY